MRLRATLFLLALSVSCVPVHADSWCDFETGLLGSRAIGYESPGSFEPYDWTENPLAGAALKTCQLLTFETPANEELSGTLRSCGDFVHEPSAYVTDESNQGLGEHPAESEYFMIQIFEAQGSWAKVKMKDGNFKRLKSRRRSGFSLYFPNTAAAGHRGVAWSLENGIGVPTRVYTAPDLTAIDETVHAERFHLRYSEEHIQGAGSFFGQPVFEMLEAVGKFDPDNMLEHINAPGWQTGFAVQYVASDVVEDTSGMLWFKADEVLTQDTLWTVERSEIDNLRISDHDKTRFNDTLYKRYDSEPLRTVYFPFRAADGAILTVLSEPSCD